MYDVQWLDSAWQSDWDHIFIINLTADGFRSWNNCFPELSSPPLSTAVVSSIYCVPISRIPTVSIPFHSQLPNGLRSLTLHQVGPLQSTPSTVHPQQCILSSCLSHGQAERRPRRWWCCWQDPYESPSGWGRFHIRFAAHHHHSCTSIWFRSYLTD